MIQEGGIAHHGKETNTIVGVVRSNLSPFIRHSPRTAQTNLEIRKLDVSCQRPQNHHRNRLLLHVVE